MKRPRRHLRIEAHAQRLLAARRRRACRKDQQAREQPPIAGSRLPLRLDIGPQLLDLDGRQHVAPGRHAVVLAVRHGVDKALPRRRWNSRRSGTTLLALTMPNPWQCEQRLRVERLALGDAGGVRMAAARCSWHIIGLRRRSGSQCHGEGQHRQSRRRPAAVISRAARRPKAIRRQGRSSAVRRRSRSSRRRRCRSIRRRIGRRPAPR